MGKKAVQGKKKKKKALKYYVFIDQNLPASVMPELPTFMPSVLGAKGWESEQANVGV